jgi:integrase/recombinase XerD
MPGKQAKVLSEAMLRSMLHQVQQAKYPDRNRLIILFSVRAGLRACEIAGLDWEMVLDARGGVSTVLTIPDRIAKKGSGRRLPLHSDLQKALHQFRPSRHPTGALLRSERGGRLRANSIVNWYVELFHDLQLKGCSSHSGRRTFITQAAKSVARTGGSLRDVQLLAGHRSIETTQAYIEGDTDAQRRIVELL